MSAGTQLSSGRLSSAIPCGRSPLAHLLHALNQPLTGLQCSLELAVSGPHSSKDYVRALREGLELTCRMRVLVEALRELADIQQASAERVVPFRLDELLLTAADDLKPVAQENGVRLEVTSGVPLTVLGNRERTATMLFRWLESALSLSEKNSNLRVTATAEKGWVQVEMSWISGALPEYSPFSRQELGLLIARAGWEQAGGDWILTTAGQAQCCTMRLPLASSPKSKPAEAGDQR